jgi:hypothetical protein
LDASDGSWTSYYADAGNRHQEQISFCLALVQANRPAPTATPTPA